MTAIRTIAGSIVTASLRARERSSGVSDWMVLEVLLAHSVASLRPARLHR